MSLRAELVRLGLRWFVKRKIGPATTLEALRRQVSRDNLDENGGGNQGLKRRPVAKS